MKVAYSKICLFSTTFIGIFVYPSSSISKFRSAAILTNPVYQTNNHSPQVSIVQPANKSVHSWNEVVPYTIEISDQEDGESKYQEIQSAEVLIKMKYVVSQSAAQAYFQQKKFSDTVGVGSLLISNCFNCHAVKIKMAGPSFRDIAMRYQNTIKNQDLLIRHIRQGSRGIWGMETMPTHTDLNEPITRQMVKWILNYAKEPGLNFIVGIQGTLPLSKPDSSTRRGAYIVEAFYTDHGSTDHPDNKLTGSARILLQMK